MPGSSSARRLAGLAASASVSALLAACSGSEPPAEAGAPPPAPPPAATDAPEGLGRAIAPPPEAMRIARLFVRTAVLRTDLELAWTITAPELRRGYTKAEWLTGSIPVVPYPEEDFEEAIYRVVQAFERDVMLEVLIVPRAGSRLRPVSFFMHLVPDGKRWLVSYWVPRGGFGAPLPS